MRAASPDESTDRAALGDLGLLLSEVLEVASSVAPSEVRASRIIGAAFAAIFTGRLANVDVATVKVAVKVPKSAVTAFFPGTRR